MKIVIVFHDHGMSGGTRALLDLIDTWSMDSSLELLCILPRRGIVGDILCEKGILYYVYPYWQAVRKGTEIWPSVIKKYIEFGLSWISTLFFTLTQLKGKNIDIVYSNTSSIFEGVWISKILKKPHVWHIREELDREHLVVPLIGEKRHYKYVVNNANLHIMISNAIYNKYSNFCGYMNRRMIYDDLSPRYLLNNRRKWEDTKRKILIAGNISQGKGHHIVIRAIKQVVELGVTCELYIAGICDKYNGAYMDNILSEIARYDLQEKIHFLGNVTDMNQLRKEMGIGIVASQNEAFGRVTIENMLAGVVTIGANDGGTAELIKDKYNGFLFSRSNYLELAQLILRVMDMTEKEISIIQERARKSAVKYTEGRCANEIIKEMQELVN